MRGFEVSCDQGCASHAPAAGFSSHCSGGGSRGGLKPCVHPVVRSGASLTFSSSSLVIALAAFIIFAIVTAVQA